MPVNLAALAANKASAAIDFGAAGTLHVAYYPARITVAMLLNVAAMQDPAALSAERALSVIGSPAEALATLLASWDLTETDADGVEQPVPCDAAHIAALGVQTLWALYAGVLSNQQQSATGEAPASGASASDAPSDATSPPTA
jgi:hypothetical protein